MQNLGLPIARPIARYVAAALFLLTCTSCSITVSSDEGSGKLSDRDIARLSAIRVSPEYVKEIQALGIRSISANDIAKFWAVKVDPDYIKKMKALGIKSISDNDIVKFWAVKVSPEFVEQVHGMGYRGISENDIVKFWAVKVTPEYIKAIKELGVGGISENDIVRYWAAGVEPEYIKKMKALGETGDRDIVKYWTKNIDPHKIVSDNGVLSITGPNGSTIVINSGKHRHSLHGYVSRIGGWATQLVIGVCLIILTAGMVAYFTRARPGTRATDWSRNIDERLSAFERRTNDVQDILISIDDRLSRQTS